MMHNDSSYIESLKFVIVGTGRCGTVYLAKLLSALELPCTHEGIFSYEGLDTALLKLNNKSKIQNSEISLRSGDWLKNFDSVQGDASYLAAPFLNHPALSNTKIIHIIRHPLKVISSLVDDFGYFTDTSLPINPDPWQEFIYSHIPVLKSPMEPLDRAALYWIEWNKMIGKFSHEERYLLHRIEDDVLPILKFLGLSQEETVKIESRHKNSQRRKSGLRDLNEISIPDIRESLLKMMTQYGYSPEVHQPTKLFL